MKKVRFNELNPYCVIHEIRAPMYFILKKCSLQPTVLYFLPDCLYPNLIPFLIQVQAIVGQVAAQYVRTFLRE